MCACLHQDGLLQERQATAAEWEAKCAAAEALQAAAEARLRDHEEAVSCQAEASVAEVRCCRGH